MPDKENVRAVFVTLRRHLARAVSRIVPPRDIEDIVQETYVRVCQVDPPETIRHPRSFLYRTACNLALDHAKRAEFRLADSWSDILDEDGDPGQHVDAACTGDETYDQVAAKQEFEFFCEAVRQLPVQCRRAFVLRKVYGYSQKEIAEALSLSESTVEKHIAYGIKRCGYYMAARIDEQAPRQSPQPSAAPKTATMKKGRRMNNVYQLPVQGRVEDEASDWLAKLDRGLSPDEERAFKAWCAQSSEHQAALLKLASLWDRMDSLSMLSDLFPRPVRTEKLARRYHPAAAAAAVGGIVIVAWLLISLAQPVLWGLADRGTPAPFNGTYETAIGTQYTASLPDGSVAVLNTGSLAKVVYSDRQRLITLERGEMNIEVAHDTQRPLTVMAGSKIVRAVGTAFNVQILNDNEVELIVTDGKVLVAQAEVGGAIERWPVRSTVVAKGERVVLGAPQEAIAKVSDSDLSAQLSWRQGDLVFRGETLAEAVVELSRYTSVKFELADESLGQIRIGGRFKAGDVDGLLATLRENFNIDYECPDAQRVLLKAR